MPQFTFIHAADLHLGAPFRGLDVAASEAFPLADAGFRALERLEAACLEHGAAFLVLAGDIYDDKDGVLRARFALRDMFLRLEKAGVRVFIAHGNHDPLPSGPLPVAWPDNVTVFGADPGCVCVERNGEPLALVHGLSHTGPRETANLAKRLAPYGPGVTGEAFFSLPGGIPADIFQVAVLHCAVGGAGEGHAPYAPCTLGELTRAGFHYWALGHVHQGKVLGETPYVVYPGSIQGLHVNETGEHGCCVVRVDGESASVTHLPLAPVTWHKVHLDLGNIETVDALEDAALEALEGDGKAEGAASALFCRLILEGRTGLDAVLRRPGSTGTLLERLRKELAPRAVWLKDIQVATAPARDEAALGERGDLVGEVARLAVSVGNDAALAADLADRALSALYGHQKLKKVLGGEKAAHDAATELAASAASLLTSLLEEE
ncbi:DNA repair exonuclease [Desulfovibrio sp. OttesenSCG-928-O18]|nr:DNA repair exonuclease [Desulfovibrio sp. OttesenSCG-928-O18]